MDTDSSAFMRVHQCPSVVNLIRLRLRRTAYSVAAGGSRPGVPALRRMTSAIEFDRAELLTLSQHHCQLRSRLFFAQVRGGPPNVFRHPIGKSPGLHPV